MLPQQQQLKNDIKALLKDFENDPDKYDSEAALESYADKLASIILDTIKSGTVAFAPGKVTGVAPPGGGPITVGTATGGTIL